MSYKRWLFIAGRNVSPFKYGLFFGKNCFKYPFISFQKSELHSNAVNLVFNAYAKSSLPDIKKFSHHLIIRVRSILLEDKSRLVLLLLENKLSNYCSES